MKRHHYSELLETVPGNQVRHEPSVSEHLNVRTFRLTESQQ